MKKNLILCFSLSLLAAWAGCSKERLGKDIYGSGTLEATEIDISSKVPGRISLLNGEEGDKLAKGALIATLDSFDQAEKDLKRAQKLYKDSVISEQQLENAQTLRDDYIIYSPIDATVVIKELNNGQVVSPGLPILTLADLGDMWVKVYITEKEIGRIKLGAEAKVFVDSFPDAPAAGKVIYVSPTAEFIPKNIQTKEERAEQVYAVKVKVENTSEKLKIGMPADVYIANQ